VELTHLVVSDPPHREIDLERAAELLGLTPAEARMKANFAAPEVWLASPEREQADDAAASLNEAGLNVVVLDARSIADVSGPRPAASFAFGETTFVARFRDGESVIAYDAPILGVFCKPPSAVERSAPSRKYYGSQGAAVQRVVGLDRNRATEALESNAMLDLYVRQDHDASRITIGQNLTEFSGLGAAMQLSGSANMRMCVSECANRFRHFVLDNRLENVRVRQRHDTALAREERKLFSFGTLGLKRLLASISPELGDLTQFEIGSRLAFLLHLARARAA
jgi:hypothetical protein